VEVISYTTPPSGLFVVGNRREGERTTLWRPRRREVD
jgi:hypothetical protein